MALRQIQRAGAKDVGQTAKVTRTKPIKDKVAKGKAAPKDSYMFGVPNLLQNLLIKPLVKVCNAMEQARTERINELIRRVEKGRYGESGDCKRSAWIFDDLAVLGAVSFIRKVADPRYFLKYNDMQRYFAVKALGEWGGKGDVFLLRQLLRYQDSNQNDGLSVRAAAAETLGKIGDKRVVKDIVNAMEDQMLYAGTFSFSYAKALCDLGRSDIVMNKFVSASSNSIVELGGYAKALGMAGEVDFLRGIERWHGGEKREYAKEGLWWARNK